MQRDLSSFDVRNHIPATEQYEHARTANIHPFYEFLNQACNNSLYDTQGFASFAISRNEKFYIGREKMNTMFGEWMLGRNKESNTTDKVIKNMLFDLGGVQTDKSVKINGKSTKFIEIDAKMLAAHLKKKYFKEERPQDDQVVDLGYKVDGFAVSDGEPSETSNTDGESNVAGDVVKRKWKFTTCLLYTSPSPRDATLSRMPSSA